MKCLPLMIAALLAGCASKSLPPDWQANAKGALDASVDDYLKGHTAASNAEFREARAETTATGRADHVAQVELVRCAAQVASLVFEDCPGYAALADGATPAQRAYAAYLAGQWDGLDVALLPEQHRAGGDCRGCRHGVNPGLAPAAAGVAGRRGAARRGGG